MTDTKQTLADRSYAGLLVVLIVGAPVTVAIGALLSMHVDPLLIWGGSDCTASTMHGQEIRSCIGYPPLGLALIAFGVVFSLSVIGGRLSQRCGTIDG